MSKKSGLSNKRQLLVLGYVGACEKHSVVNRLLLPIYIFQTRGLSAKGSEMYCRRKRDGATHQWKASLIGYLECCFFLISFFLLPPRIFWCPYPGLSLKSHSSSLIAYSTGTHTPAQRHTLAQTWIWIAPAFTNSVFISMLKPSSTTTLITPPTPWCVWGSQ